MVIRLKVLENLWVAVEGEGRVTHETVGRGWRGINIKRGMVKGSANRAESWWGGRGAGEEGGPWHCGFGCLLGRRACGFVFGRRGVERKKREAEQ